MLEQSYTSQPAGSPQGTGSVQPEGKSDYWPLSKLRRCYTDFLFAKRQELDEQIDARRYYHGSQWTAEQIRIMKKRKQPVMTFNRIARKIDGVVGLIEKLRQDPKAYARTPQHEQGADLATAALRYVLDEQEWKAKSPICASDGAIDGIGGIEIELTQGDQGDPEIGLEVVDVASYFYEPTSYKDDFSDAGYQGIGKWLDQDIARQMWPDAPDDAFSAADFELVNNSDREIRWFSTSGSRKRVRIIDIWYRHNGGYCYAIFSGNHILQEGRSYLKDEKGKDYCKYIMFSGNVDQDGDRYGFIRNMKSAQDGLNAKQSKLQHIIASKRLILSQGAVDDIEKVRAEWARPDGVVITNRPVNEGVKLDDQSFDFSGLEKLLQLNMQEIENFGPNHALIGQGGVESNSGRAIALLQQAGMAELGPYILAYRGWKIRIYRAIWNAVQQHWKAERWVRVTDDQQLAQYIQINGVQMGPTGPTLVNAIGSLDVDIILDEGPDHVNAMADMYETLQNVLPSIAPVLTPQKAALVVDTLIETSPLDASIKKRFREQSQQEAQAPPQVPPEVQAMQAKAHIDLQSQQSAAQLEEQRNQQANAARAEAANIDLERKRIEAQQALEHRNAEMAMERQHNEHLHQQTMAHETAKANLGLDHETAKADLNLRHEKAKSEITTKTQKDTAEIKKRQMLAIADPEAANDLESFDAMKELLDTFKTGMKELADSIKSEDKGEAKTITIQRDKTGKVVGAKIMENA